MKKKQKKRHIQKKQILECKTNNRTMNVIKNKKETEKSETYAINEKVDLNDDASKVFIGEYTKFIDKKDEIKKIDLEQKNGNVVKDVVSSEIIQKSKLDLTTKILIVLFTILMLIVIFAKKFGIEGFP